MKTLKQQLREKDRKVYNTPICGSPLYQERDVLEAVEAWLTQKRQEMKHLPEKVSYGALWVLDELLEETKCQEK